MASLNDSMPRAAHTVYLHGSLTYLPHYSRTGYFVSPGYGQTHNNTLTEIQLINAGAKPVTAELWERNR